MMIKVSELEEAGITVEDTAAIGVPFADASWQLDEVDLSVTPDGRDVLVQGRLSATVPQVCSRCLESFPAAVHPNVDVRLVPRPATGDSVELGQDDLDVDFYSNDLLDLAALIETETTLALPMKPLCRTDCQGLCRQCGANRNVVPCDCPSRTADPRLAALGRLAVRLHDTN